MQITKALLATAVLLAGAASQATQSTAQAPTSTATSQQSSSLQADVDRLRSESDAANDNHEYARAATISAELLPLQRRLSGARSLGYARALAEHGENLYWAEKPAQAEPYLLKAMQLRQALAGSRDEAIISVIGTYADTLYAKGQTEKSLRYYRDELKRARAIFGPAGPYTINRLALLAIRLGTLGRHADAIPLWIDLVEVQRMTPGTDPKAVTVAMHNYADTLMQISRYDEGEAIFAQRLEEIGETSGPMSPEVAKELESIIFSLNSYGRLTQAEVYSARLTALQQAGSTPQSADALDAMDRRGKLLLELDRPAEAEPLLAQVLQSRRKTLGNKNYLTQLSITAYAKSLAALERYDEADALYAERIALDRGPDGKIDAWDGIQILEDLGSNLLSSEHYAEAEPLLREALDLRLGNDVLRQSLGTVWRAQDLALAQLLQTSPKRDALVAAREAIGGARSRNRAVLQLVGADDSEKDAEHALLQTSDRLLMEAIWREVRGAPAGGSPFMADAFEAIQEAGSGATTRAIANTASKRYAAGERAGSLVAERAQLATLWAMLDGQLAGLEKEIGPEPAAERKRLRARLDMVARRSDAIFEAIKTEAPQFFEILAQPALSIAQAQALLRSTEAVLLIDTSYLATHIMVLTRDGIVWRRSALKEKNIAENVAALRRGLELPGQGRPPVDPFNRTIAHELYNTLISPVRDALAKRSHIFIVAGGPLASLPFGVLVTEPPAPNADPDTDNNPNVLRSTPWFADADGHALIQLPSLQSLAYLRRYNVRSAQVGQAAAFAGYGNPMLASGSVVPATMPRVKGLMSPALLRKLAALPGTVKELDDMRDLLKAPPSAVHLGATMTETAIRGSDLSKTAVLHIATHGLLPGQSGAVGEAGLVFSPPAKPTQQDDGYLAASEVLGLDLNSANWIILSACNTANPAGTESDDGLSSLERAFFYAGAHSMLVSHWAVYDDIAAELSVDTLGRSMRGISRAEALTQAMTAIRNDPTKQAEHPSIWAPFALIGESE